MENIVKNLKDTITHPQEWGKRSHETAADQLLQHGEFSVTPRSDQVEQKPVQQGEEEVIVLQASHKKVMPRIQLAPAQKEYHDFTIEDNYQPIPPPKPRVADRSPKRPEVYQAIPPPIPLSRSSEDIANAAALSPKSRDASPDGRRRSFDAAENPKRGMLTRTDKAYFSVAATAEHDVEVKLTPAASKKASSNHNSADSSAASSARDRPDKSPARGSGESSARAEGERSPPASGSNSAGSSLPSSTRGRATTTPNNDTTLASSDAGSTLRSPPRIGAVKDWMPRPRRQGEKTPEISPRRADGTFSKGISPRAKAAVAAEIEGATLRITPADQAPLREAAKAAAVSALEDLHNRGGTVYTPLPKSPLLVTEPAAFKGLAQKNGGGTISAGSALAKPSLSAGLLEPSPETIARLQQLVGGADLSDPYKTVFAPIPVMKRDDSSPSSPPTRSSRDGAGSSLAPPAAPSGVGYVRTQPKTPTRSPSPFLAGRGTSEDQHKAHSDHPPAKEETKL